MNEIFIKRVLIAIFIILFLSTIGIILIAILINPFNNNSSFDNNTLKVKGPNIERISLDTALSNLFQKQNERSQQNPSILHIEGYNMDYNGYAEKWTIIFSEYNKIRMVTVNSEISQDTPIYNHSIIPAPIEAEFSPQQLFSQNRLLIQKYLTNESSGHSSLTLSKSQYVFIFSNMSQTTILKFNAKTGELQKD